MKNLNFKTPFTPHLLALFLLVLTGVSCSNFDDETSDDEEQAVLVSDSWICILESFEEDYWYYELHIDNNGDYVAISDTRMLKVSKDGMLNTMVILNYNDDNNDIVRFFNDKIYRFHYDNDFQVFDPVQPIELQVYDLDFNLISDQVLDSNGIIYDVEIESDNVFGLLIYTPDDNTMKLKRIHQTNGLQSEVVLSTSGTHPRNLEIFETGEYFCTDGSNKDNLYLLDNDLNLQWAKEIDYYLISDVKYISGQGICIFGDGSYFGPTATTSYVTMLDLDGNVINEGSYESGDTWNTGVQVNEDYICITHTEPETNRNMLYTLLDHDLNLETMIEIPGSKVTSNIVINDLGSFSFMYGQPIDPNDPGTFVDSNTRIFKFDDPTVLPTDLIFQ